LVTSWDAGTQTSTLSATSVYSANSTYTGTINNVNIVVTTNNSGAIIAYSSSGTTASGVPFSYTQSNLNDSEVFVIEATNYALNKIDGITSNDNFTDVDIVMTFDESGNLSTYSKSMIHSDVGAISTSFNDVTSTNRAILESAYNDIDNIESEFQVNTTSFHNQRDPDSTTLSDGSFVVVWASKYQDGDNYGIYAQHFDVSGNKLGSEIQVNAQSDGIQVEPSISALNDGGYVVAWVSGVWDNDADTWALDQGQDGSSAGIYAQRFDSNDNPVGIETQVNTYTFGEQYGASVAGLSGGGYIVSWESYEQDGDSWGVYAQQFDINGGVVNLEFLVNTYTDSYQSRSDVTALNDGGYVVTWRSSGQDGSASGIFAQRYDANGNKVNIEFSVNTETNSTQSYPAITTLTDGGYVITWVSKYQDGSYYGIYAQRYNENDTENGGE